MPDCSRINKFDLTRTGDHWKVTLNSPLGSDKTTFSVILRNSFQGARLTSSQKSSFNPSSDWVTQFSIPLGSAHRTQLREFLNLLRQSVTISDDADESHALSLHHLYHLTDGPGEQRDHRRTEIGDLTIEAKSYDLSDGNMNAALDLTMKIESWIKRHPRYRAADVIIPVPLSNPCKTFDLPEFIAQRISGSLAIPAISCKKIAQTRPQKTLMKELKQLLPEEKLGKLHANQRKRATSRLERVLDR